MKIEKKPTYIKSLQNILRYIANDKIAAAQNFEQALNKKIKSLVDFPLMYHRSFYFKNEAYRDMEHKGYTIIYKVEGELISILEIFKWQNVL